MIEIREEEYGLGKLTLLEVDGRQAYIIAPCGLTDDRRR